MSLFKYLGYIIKIQKIYSRNIKVKGIFGYLIKIIVNIFLFLYVTFITLWDKKEYEKTIEIDYKITLLEEFTGLLFKE
jgi:hypothetical protein